MTEKKGVWGSLRGAFVEEVPDAHQSAPPPVASTPIPSAPVQWPAPGIPGGTWSALSVQPSVGVDPNLVAKIEAKLQAATPPVYAAFMEQFEALKDVIPDEGTRFRAALKTSHASPEQISGALDQLIGVANGALQEFNATFEGKKNQVLGGAQQQIDADSKSVSGIVTQINGLQEQVTQLQTRVVNMQHQMQADAAHLDGVKQGFQAAHAQVVGRLNADKNRITTQRI